MARARNLSIVLVSIALIVSVALPVSGQDWLPNGDFESGTSGWSFTGATPAACEPQAGSAAIGISPTSPQGYVEGFIPGPIVPGTYTLTGWTKIQSGTGFAEIKLAFLGEFGSTGGIAVPTGLVTGGEYTFFSATVDANREYESGLLAFYFTPDTTAVFCIDSLRLTTEDPTATPTPSPTATQPPDATATHTPAATATATPLVPTATDTPSPTPACTATTAPSATTATNATRTPTPAPTATSGPSFVFSNGGFEQGLSGWSKYGGSLTTTSSALSGSTAGLLISDTESTKWAYQSVQIDPAQHYEFAGHVQAGEGVSEAYLRISWYATSDATGSALATTDSSQRAGPGGYVFLTTGPVQPPAGAASARVRVVLAPEGGATSSLSIDDVTFGTTAAATPTPTASVTPTAIASGTAPPSPTVALLGAIASAPQGDAEAGPAGDQAAAHSVLSQALAAPVTGGASTAVAAASLTPEPVQQVASARSQASASASGTTEPGALANNETSEGFGAGSWPWALGAGLLVVGLGGAYVQGRRGAG